ncbi:peptide-methionine (S)-S-oxide reductase MsrA [Cysteiniphilum sp. QT6929]|uniref:peptide-methionine (S)-S-oxide reductase MsrA n=1 Tax=Cysteiniphilum sp. QT6929 TaxID=2975055 RepID=UPI0024B33487|nr:peptide-methionine (S)-S-oxide reductase MsrA [Cysteiniphilum sp. QT6929]WHN66334.1 peptide-methionine (S)-S-oxide reductase MsrA [Cysteiniphilum sp. QT6929]
MSDQLDVAYFAAGCFWGVEHYFAKEKGVVKTAVGYMAGKTLNPTYHNVKTGQTEHLEVVKVEYDCKFVSYETLVKLFFEIHDPTQQDGQGIDIGSQYLSAILYTNGTEKMTCQQVIDCLEAQGLTIATQLIDANLHPFWLAEDYHQQYFNEHAHLHVCHRRVKRFD